MNIELYTLRIFSKVMELQSFSEAGRHLGLTQPTISQQISKLEGTLGKRLFERVRHEIIPTAIARQLLPYAQQMLSLAEETENFLSDQKTKLRGDVSYAMPESCQWTPHFRHIMSEIRTLPDVQFKIGILPTDKVAMGIVEGEYDFGFIVGEKLHPELSFEKFADEPYAMVGADDSIFEAFRKKKYDQVRIVTFPGWELFFTTWLKTHGIYSDVKKNMKTPSVNIGTLAGAIHAIQEGAGAGVLPLQCVPAGLAEFKIKNTVASNPIYVAKRVGDKLTKRAETVLEMLKKSKKELG
jgi:DNA-binding transcriptional LysR family regulator